MPSLPTPADFSDCRNLLEPPEYAALFARFPPSGFTLLPDVQRLSRFSLKFDLLTTLESVPRARIRALPFFQSWSGLLRRATCFTGTSITEYSPLPRAFSPRTLLDVLESEMPSGQSLVIVKDLPNASPFLPVSDNDFSDALAAEAEKRGFITVEGQALAYVAIDFHTMEDYMSRFSAIRRKEMRRKLKKRAQLEIERIPLGDARFSDKALLEEMYAMYRQVYAQSDLHFDLLSPDFFTALLCESTRRGVVFFYRHRGELAGYNLCLIHHRRLIDKYIGFKYPLARELNLYFISWFVNLEFALDNGLNAYIAGWTDPEVKRALGASFTFTRHLVQIRDPLLRCLLLPLRRFFEVDARTLSSSR